MNWRPISTVRSWTIVFIAGVGATVIGFGLWAGKAAHAARTPLSGEVLTYASPVEMLFSPDGARLYVLCQQANEVRVLDATSYTVLKNIEVGQAPRGFSLSPKGDRLVCR